MQNHYCFVSHIHYDRWKGLEPRLYKFQNTDDEVAWLLLADAKLLVSIFSRDQEWPKKGQHKGKLSGGDLKGRGYIFKAKGT